MPVSQATYLADNQTVPCNAVSNLNNRKTQDQSLSFLLTFPFWPFDAVRKWVQKLDGTQTEYLFPLSQSQGSNLVGKVEKL